MTPDTTPAAVIDPKSARLRLEKIDGLLCLTAQDWRESSDADFSAAVARVNDLRDRALPWLVPPMRLERRGKSECLVMAQPQGQPLLQTAMSNPLSLAIDLASALEALHDAGLVHGYLSPDAVFLDQGRLQLALVPNSLHVRLDAAVKDRASLDELPYLAPEQTGRIPAPTDRRADLYSLGALLFRLTEGRPPFASGDRMELLHQIIAVPAPDAASAPPTLRQIIARLLTKSPEGRYQSAWGLGADLRRCLATPDAPFDIGQADRRASFLMPKKLFGREADLLRLTTFCTGRPNEAVLTLIGGFSGVGKSSLVQAFLAAATQDGTLVMAGKYDQLQTLPYKAILEALRSFVQRMLIRSPDRRAAWVEQVKSQVGPGLDALAEFVPELELLLGERPAPTRLDPGEREERFQLAIRSLFETLATPDTPAILFLDDVQWADSASFKVIENILAASDAGNLIILAAFRANEVDERHPLRQLTARLGDAGHMPREMTVTELDQDAICDLVGETLSLPPNRVTGLARQMLAKTFGNPFHLRQLLTSLHETGAIAFDRQAGQWHWHDEVIQARVLNADIAQLLAGRLGRLSEDARETLAAAACLGATFSASAIASIDPRPPEARARGLEQAEAEGLILRDRLADQSDVWTFSHDRVQEASYARLTTAQARARHADIAKGLIADITDPNRDARLFAAMDQCAKAGDFVSDAATGRRLTALALAAAIKAKSVGAHDLAVTYLSQAAAVPADLSGLNWSANPDQTSAFHVEMMEAQFLAHGWDHAEPHFNTLIAQVKDRSQKALIHQLATQLLTLRVDFDRANRFGVEGARLLGSKLSAPLGPKIGLALANAFRLQRHPERFDFASLPQMQDPERLAMMNVLITVATPALMSNPDLFVLVSLKMYNITLRYGMTDPGAGSISSFAVVLYMAFDAVDRAYEIERRLEEYLETQPVSDRVRGRIIFGRAIMLDWYKEPYAQILPKMDAVARYSRRGADFEFLGYSSHGRVRILLAMGHPLHQLSAEINTAQRLGRQLRHDTLLGGCAAWRRMIDSATRTTAGPLWGPEDEAVLAMQQSDMSKANVYASIFLLAVMEEDYALAETLRARLNDYPTFTKLAPGIGEVLLQTVILCRAQAGEGDTATRRKAAARGRKAATKLAKLARAYPVNLRIFGLILQAMQTEWQDGAAEAITAYDAAIRACREDKILQFAALAADLAARGADKAGLLAERDRRLREARGLYDAWGASYRSAQLVNRYPQVFEAMPGAEPSVDLGAITRAAHAIFESLDFSTLVRQLLTIAVTNAGADRGALYTMRDGQPALIAESRVEKGQIIVTETASPQPLTALDPARHPVTIVAAVTARESPVLLDDASSAPGEFEGSLYLQTRSPRSVMCMPVVRSGKLEALLYVENSLSARVFTPARRDVLETVVGLAAISLVNAQLFAQQEEALRLERRATEELNRLSRMKDEFLANTSHELRTPLNGIIGLAGSLADGAKGPLPAPAIDTLNLLVTSGRRLEALVNDILDFSSLKVGGLDLRSVPIDLRAMVELAAAILGPRARDSGTEIENVVPEGMTVLADEYRLQQILINLLDNAVKFTRAGRVRIEAQRHGARAEIAVTDTGIGIPLEHRDRIFQSFEQLDASIAREYGGTGLGLAIARQLVELHGGKIRVADQDGPGTRMVFDVAYSEQHPLPPGALVPALLRAPLRPLQPVLVDRTQPAPPDQPRGTVLVVDDDAINREVLQNYLGLSGYHTVTADSGEEALRLLASGLRPEVALLDIMMPRMSGYELFRQIRANDPTSRMPVIMLTAKNRVEDLEAAFDSGANDYIAKPFIKEELLARVRSHVELARTNAAYERFVPTEFLHFLKRDRITDINLGDNIACQMSVMFTDIRNFTTLTEQLTPSESFEFLIEYFSAISPPVYDHGGFLNQYSGDGMMALFSEHPESAVKAAIGIQSVTSRLNASGIRSKGRQIDTGIGLHLGDLVLGIIGHEHRRTGNVVSDAVNLASRIENLTAHYGIRIATSRDLLDRLPDPERYPHRELDLVLVKGREMPVAIYEIFAGDDPEMIDLKSASRPDFSAGISAFRAGRFSDAVGLFSRVLSANPRDEAAANFQRRSAGYLVSGTPPGWDGVVRIGKITE